MAAYIVSASTQTATLVPVGVHDQHLTIHEHRPAAIFWTLRTGPSGHSIIRGAG
jgi:hypothetical protein